MSAFVIILAFLCFFVTALSLGLTLLRVVRCRLDLIERLCLALVAGASLLSLLVFALGMCGLVNKALFISLSGIALIGLLGRYQWLLPKREIDAPRIGWDWKLLFLGVLCAYGGWYYLPSALAPEHSPDANSYHLGLVNLYYHAHRIKFYWSMYAALPQGMEMLFLYVFPIGRNSAAALVHFSFLMVLPALIVLYGRRFGFYNEAICAGLLVFTVPLIGRDGTSAYNDVALAAVIFASFFLLRIWQKERGRGELWVACLLAGFAFAIKYTAGFYLLFFVSIVMWSIRKESRRRILQVAGPASALLLLLPSVYLIRNIFWYHNPIAFFGNSIFPNPYFHISFEKAYVYTLVHLHDLTWSEIPAQLTYEGSKTAGNFGPVFVLAPLALVGLIWPESRILTLAALVTGISYQGNKDARFVIPFFPFIALSMVYVLTRITRSQLFAVVILAVHLVLSWPPVYEQLFNSHGWRGWHLDPSVSWDVALRRESEEHYLTRISKDYQMARLMDSVIQGEALVLAFDEGPPQAYMRPQLVVWWHSALGDKLTDILYSTFERYRSGSYRWAFHFPAGKAKAVRLVFHGEALNGKWSIHEIRPGYHGKQIDDRADWRADANPFHWDANLAFDGNDLTEWESWQQPRPGMWVGAQFKHSQTIDSIEVSDTHESEFTLELQDVDGRWRPLGAPVETMEPPCDMRKSAGQLIKRFGFDYVLFLRADPSHNDLRDALRDSAEAWGFRPVVSTAQSILFKIE